MSVAVVFDFDETLTSGHLYHLQHGKHRIKSWFDEKLFPDLRREHMAEHREFLVHTVFGGEERLATLAAFLQSLWDLGDVGVMISSNNYLSTIISALTVVDLLRYFLVINAHDALYHSVAEDMRTGVVTHGIGRKDQFLVNHVLGVMGYRACVFVDDDARNWDGGFHPGAAVEFITWRHDQTPGMNAEDRERVMDATQRALEKVGGSAGRGGGGGLSRIKQGALLCFECVEREAVLYSAEHDAAFCDRLCMGRYPR